MTFIVQEKKKSVYQSYLCQTESLGELSRESDIVEAITGKKRTDQKLFYPHDLIYEDGRKGKYKERIIELLEGKK